jgi:hypothetical protein
MKLHTALQNNAEAAMLALDRERGTNQYYSEFHNQVFESVFGAFIAALNDALSEKPPARIHVTSAPVGCGKTTCGMACVAGLINSTAEFEEIAGYAPTALFVVEQIKRADEIYHTLCSLLGGDKVAVWSKDHDTDTSSEQRTRLDHVSSTFSQDDLQRFPVAVITHSLFKGKNGGKARVINGRTRTITIIDEEIKETHVYDVDAADIQAARKRAIEHAKAAGPNSVAAEALTALTELAEFASAKEGKDVKKRSLEAVDNDNMLFDLDNPLPWFFTKEAQHYAKGHADEAMATVFGFGRALATGYAFLSRAQAGRSVETRYVGYEHSLRCDPGTVLLDATADLSGMTQLCPWRVPRDIPQARYDRLTVIAEKPYPVRRLDLLFKKAQGRREYTDWMIATIKRHAHPGQPTLIVCKLDLINNEHVTAPMWDIGGGYQVHVAHWGDGIGSNLWKDCRAVFLFGEFYIPRRVHIADTQALLNCKATDSGAPTMTMGAINGHNHHVDAIAAGHLLRFDKQMALRGNARHFDEQGVCGEQKLICCGDTKLLLVNLERMYPGARLVNAGGVGAARGGSGGKQTYGDRVLSLLSNPDGTTTVSTAALDLGKPWRKISKDVLTPTFKAALNTLGWDYVVRKGRAAEFHRRPAVGGS